jgi:hypothetical protein
MFTFANEHDVGSGLVGALESDGMAAGVDRDLTTVDVILHEDVVDEDANTVALVRWHITHFEDDGRDSRNQLRRQLLACVARGLFAGCGSGARLQQRPSLDVFAIVRERQGLVA